MKQYLLFALLLGMALSHADAQGLSTAPSGDNQKCSVTQHIGGIASVTVDYSSPDVTSPTGDDRNGHIWGELVPYGLTDLGFGLRNPSPWRAGANENTVITFSNDVEIEGKPLKAGKYGLHLIVNETGPWTWIFSKNSSAWGSFYYEEKDDALRVDVAPVDNPYHEWLTYEFTDRQPESCELSLMWENKRIPMRIEVADMDDLYYTTLQNELTGSAGFQYQNWVTASAALTAMNYKLDKALEWADNAISAPFIGEKNWTTLQNKAAVLTAMGKEDEAMSTMDDALELQGTTAFQIHQYGRQLIAQGNPEAALKVFELNYTKFEGAWPTAVGMARGLSAVGRYDEALKYAEMSVEQSPDDLNRNAMKAAVEKLKARQDIN